MHSTVVALLSVAALVSAQSFSTGGQGRFPCSTIVSGVVVVDQTACSDANIASLQTPGCEYVPGMTVDGDGFKNFGPIPTGSTCVLASAGGGFYCGIAGAACSSDANCDNGSCDTTTGLCTGGLGDPCTLDSECTGNIYCLNPNQESTGAAVCGFSDTTDGTGALCDDGCVAGNFLCISNVCDGNTGTCFPTLAGASQRARSRRDNITPRGSRCPASHTACAVSGLAKGFECIDTTSNLEQCGACASQGGVDCTALPGVDAVGCVAGQCEIWACAEGFIWDAESSSCSPALIA